MEKETMEFMEIPEEITFDAMPQLMLCMIHTMRDLTVRMGKLETAKGDGKPWLNITELRNYIPFKPALVTVQGWMRANKIPYYIIGSHSVFNKEEIDKWLKGQGYTPSKDVIMQSAEEYIKSHPLEK